VGPTADGLQDALSAFRRTQLGRTLHVFWSAIGVHREAKFSKDHAPAFLRGAPPRGYVCVYPFVRSYDWYLLPAHARAQMLTEHGRMGSEYPQVLANTVSAFALGDYEWRPTTSCRSSTSCAICAPPRRAATRARSCRSSRAGGGRSRMRWPTSPETADHVSKRE
jgi:chlorite dismutase